MANKWIQDWTLPSPGGSIPCKEVTNYRNESYNSITGNPQFTTRVEINFAHTVKAIQRLLGQPERLVPSGGAEYTFVCVDAKFSHIPEAKYTTDLPTPSEFVIPADKVFLDLTYIPRKGRYVLLTANDPATGSAANQPVYLDDDETPRYETVPFPPQMFVWGTTADSPTTLPTNPVPLTANEVPAEFRSGQTLVHTLEGWCGNLSGGTPVEDLTDFIGTVHNADYISPITFKVYKAGTLMLRSYTLEKTFNFRSYRENNDPAAAGIFYDPSGGPCPTLKLTYEYKKAKWKKFTRINLEGNSRGEYYIHYAQGSKDRYFPFPDKDHSIFFQHTVLF